MPYFENICDDCGSPTIPIVPIVIPPLNSCCVWGKITGSLTDQIDLTTALNGKFNIPVGTTSQYIRGNGTLATLPTFASTWGTITGTLSAQTDLNTVITTINTAITTLQTTKFNNPTGTVSQYIKGDGTLGTLPASAIPVWGTIIGTLANQADLQTALNAKFNKPTGAPNQYLRGDGTTAIFPIIPTQASFASQLDNENAATESSALIPDASNVENGKISSPQGLFYFIQKLKLQNISWTGFHTFLNGLNIQTSNPNSINKQVGVDINGNVVLVPVSGAALVVAGQTPSEDAATNATITTIDNTSYASPRSLRYFIEKVKTVVNTWTGLNIFSGGVRLPSITTVNLATDGTGNIIASPDVNLLHTYFVSVNGNNTTAQKGNIKRPYLTITAALTAATAGDCIYVIDGVFDENNLDITNKYLYLAPSASINYTAAQFAGDAPTNYRKYYSIFLSTNNTGTIQCDGSVTWSGPVLSTASIPIGIVNSINSIVYNLINVSFKAVATTNASIARGISFLYIDTANVTLNTNATFIFSSCDFITVGYISFSGSVENCVTDYFAGGGYVSIDHLYITSLQKDYLGRGLFYNLTTIVNKISIQNILGATFNIGCAYNYTEIGEIIILSNPNSTVFSLYNYAGILAHIKIKKRSDFLNYIQDGYNGFNCKIQAESFASIATSSANNTQDGSFVNELTISVKMVFGDISLTPDFKTVRFTENMTVYGRLFSGVNGMNTYNVVLEGNTTFILTNAVSPAFVLTTQFIIYNYGNIYTNSTNVNAFSSIINTTKHPTKGYYLSSSTPTLETGGLPTRGIYDNQTLV